MHTLLYHGSKDDRLRMRVENGFEKKQKPGKKYPVVITSFEVAMNDVKKLDKQAAAAAAADALLAEECATAGKQESGSKSSKKKKKKQKEAAVRHSLCT